MAGRDPFEDRLRDTLRGGDRSGQPDVDGFLADVHRGARARRRRHAIEIGAAAAVVVVGVGAAMGSLGLFESEQPSAVGQPTRPTTQSTAPTEPSAPTEDTSTAPAIHFTSSNTQVLSLTSTGNDHQWALIAADDPTCALAQCLGVVAYSPGAGGWGEPFPLSTPGAADVPGVSQLRFVGDASGGYDGWAFGPGLMSIHGVDTPNPASWNPVRLSGAVTSLEARGSTVYALVRDGGRSSLESSPVDSDDFKEVATGPFELGDASDLVVTQGVVAMLADVGGETTVLWSPADPETGEATGEWGEQNPCTSGGEPTQLTSASSTLWVLCSDFNDSKDADVMAGGPETQWTICASGVDPNSELAATSPQSAVIAEPSGMTLVPSTNTAQTPLSTDDFSDTSFLGFTNETLGFAIADGTLWRTTDGGQTWAVDPVLPPH